MPASTPCCGNFPSKIGQRVAAGANLARIAQPQPLKAELRVADTQARDIAAGQFVTIDTRNGTAPGRLTRVIGPGSGKAMG